MLTGYYGGGTPANVSWQASQIADREHQFGVAYHIRWAHAAQQGKEKIGLQKEHYIFLWQIARDEKRRLYQ